jgi:hypothetical protein
MGRDNISQTGGMMIKHNKSFRLVPFTAINHLHLTVERYDTQSKTLIECVADIYHPVLVEANSIWWGHSCFLPIPFELSKPDTYLVVKVSSGNDGEREELGWTYLNIDKDTVDTKMLRLKMFSGVYEYSSMAFNTAVPNGTFIDVDFSLVRRSDPKLIMPDSPRQRQRRRYTVAAKASKEELTATRVASSSSLGSFATPRKGGNNGNEDFASPLTPPFTPFQDCVQTPPDTIPRSKTDVVLTPSGYSELSGQSGYGSPHSADSSPERGRPPVAKAGTQHKGINNFSTNNLTMNTAVQLQATGLSSNVPLGSGRSKLLQGVSGLHKYTARELENIRRINTREYVDGAPLALFVMRIPDGVRPGITITNIGGRKDRSLVVPTGVKGGDVVLIAAVP